MLLSLGFIHEGVTPMTLNPRIDFAFKKLFGSVENKDILISFINAVVEQQCRIKDVTLLNPYNHKEYPSDKLSILDIKATDEEGRQYNIEMQLNDQVCYNQRALYYWSKLYASQLTKGKPFSELKKTISINILNFNYFPDEVDYHNIFHIRSVKSNKRYFEDLELHFIELEKFNKELDHLKTTLNRWTTFLKRAERYEQGNIPPELNQEPAIEKAIITLETLYLNAYERDVYEVELKWQRDEEGALMKAHLNGLAEGLAEGRSALKETAKKLLNENIPINVIANATGLSLEEVEQLSRPL